MDPVDGLGNPPNPPYHLVNKSTWQHLGPFTTYLDAALCRTVAGGVGWGEAEIMNKTQFENHLGWTRT